MEVMTCNDVEKFRDMNLGTRNLVWWLGSGRWSFIFLCVFSKAEKCGENVKSEQCVHCFLLSAWRDYKHHTLGNVSAETSLSQVHADAQSLQLPPEMCWRKPHFSCLSKLDSILDESSDSPNTEICNVSCRCSDKVHQESPHFTLIKVFQSPAQRAFASHWKLKEKNKACTFHLGGFIPFHIL